MHRKGQALAQRQAKDERQSQFLVAPILEIVTSQSVASIQWSNQVVGKAYDEQGDEEDALLLGYKYSAKVDWIPLEPLIDRYQTAQRAVQPHPNQDCTSFWYPRSTGTVRGLRLFSSPGKSSSQRTLLVYCDKTVYAWKLQLRSTMKPTVSLHWRYQLSSKKGNVGDGVIFTSCLPIGPHWLLLGTSRGSLIGLDWTQTTRERSFSSERRPVVVIDEWTPHKRLWKHTTCQQQGGNSIRFFNKQPARAMQSRRMPSCWGIVQLQMVSNNHHQCDSLPNTQAGGSQPMYPPSSCQGRRTIRWVTAGGWVLECPLEVTNKAKLVPSVSQMEVLHRPPRVKLQSCDGTELSKLGDNSGADGSNDYDSLYSLPLDKMCSCSTGSSLIWSHVPSSVKRFGHHDKYVVESGQSQLFRSQSKKRFMRVLSSRNIDGRASAIAMPADGKSPQVMTVHPDLEWMVVGTEQELLLMINNDSQ